jgi:methylmalonyl-CoA mutase
MTDLAALIAAFKASGANLVCLCSSDKIYETEGARAAQALAAASPKHVYLAGRPKDETALLAAGVQSFVYSGCDALTTLKSAHDMLAA